MTGLTVFVDSTALYDDLTLSRTPWVHVLSLVAHDKLQLVVSEVVLREAERHRAEQVVATWEALQKSAGKLPRAVKALRELGVEVEWPELPLVGPTADLEEGVDAVRRRLVGLGARILPLPGVTHSDVLFRDLSRTKPFAANGKGYRDCLIWESFRAFIDGLPLHHRVLFVTANTSDFCDDVRGGLDAGLLAELGPAAPPVEWLPDLSAVLAHADVAPAVAALAKTEEELREYLADRLVSEIDFDEPDARPSVSELIELSLMAACEELVGEAVRLAEYDDEYTSTGHDFASLGLPPQITEAEIEEVAAVEGTEEWQTYETYEGGTLLVQASIVADLSIQGYLFKGDFYVLDRDEVHILDWEWNEHMARVSATTQARLIFQLRVEAGAGLVDDVQLEGAEPLPGPVGS